MTARIGSLSIILGNGKGDEVSYATVPLFAEASKSGKSQRVTFGNGKSSATVPLSMDLPLSAVVAFEVNAGKGGTVRMDCRDGVTGGDSPKNKRHAFGNVPAGKSAYAVYPQVTLSRGGDLSLFVRGSEGAAPEPDVDRDALAELFG